MKTIRKISFYQLDALVLSLIQPDGLQRKKAVGAFSQGEYWLGIMKQVGYDFAVLGNHTFDYGMEQLAALWKKTEAQY